MSDFAKEAAPDATGKCGELVTVKPLEWNPFRAETPFGYYSVDDQTDRDEKELRWRPPFLLSGSRVDLQRFWTLEEARAAAQAHFNARVLSLVTRSQAVELLAAERNRADANFDKAIEQGKRAADLEADNAALTARVKELEERLKTAYETKHQCNEDANAERKARKAIETKFAAAQKALEPFVSFFNEAMKGFTEGYAERTPSDKPVLGWNNAYLLMRNFIDARAVLGGKPS